MKTTAYQIRTRNSYLILSLLFLATPLHSQETSRYNSTKDTLENDRPNHVEFRIGNLDRLFRPLVANTFEARLGMMSHLQENQVRLDIGNSVDLLRLTVKSSTGKHEFSLGADFFTYTLLKGEEGFHFPVDAADYLFGLNLNYCRLIGTSELAARFRLSHMSAHFVDGHFDGTTARWKDRDPQVYSREFVDLVVSYGISPMRYYIGGSYLIHVDPSWLPRTAFQAGAEVNTGELVHENVIGYAAIDLRLVDIETYSGVSTVQFGVKFGHLRGPSVDLFSTYFSGYSTSGEYYDIKMHYWALGFLVDF